MVGIAILSLLRMISSRHSNKNKIENCKNRLPLSDRMMCTFVIIFVLSKIGRNVLALGGPSPEYKCVMCGLGHNFRWN